jgi:hypothetical protein
MSSTVSAVEDVPSLLTKWTSIRSSPCSSYRRLSADDLPMPHSSQYLSTRTCAFRSPTPLHAGLSSRFYTRTITPPKFHRGRTPANSASHYVVQTSALLLKMNSFFSLGRKIVGSAIATKSIPHDITQGIIWMRKLV